MDECLRKRDFQVSFRFRGSLSRTDKSQVDFADPPTLPSLPPASLVCECPPLDQCRYEYKFPSQFCGMHAWLVDFNSTFTMQQHTVTVPYITTVLETVASGPPCQWLVDLGSGPVQTGLSYQGEREVDQNKVTIRFNETSDTCACCKTITFASEGAHTQQLNVHYAWRCVYSQPPAYMSIQRAAPAAYLNWTYEVAGGFFIVRNAANVIQDQVNMNGLTLAQALVAINAMASVVAVANFGAVPADTMPATLIEDRAAALIPWPFFAPLHLFEPDVREVEHYQDGRFGPAWRIYETSYATCGLVFPLKQGGCGPSTLDYTQGTTPFSEAEFCKGIGTEFADWPPVYDPVSGAGIAPYECNFISFGRVNPTILDHPCDEDTGEVSTVVVVPCDSEPSACPGAWNWVVGAFGNRATYVGFSQDFCSDYSKIRETICTDQTSVECDFCECAGGEYQVKCGAYRLETREGWRVAKAFQVVRL